MGANLGLIAVVIDIEGNQGPLKKVGDEIVYFTSEGSQSKANQFNFHKVVQAGVKWSSKETVTAVVHIYSDFDFEGRVPRDSDFEGRAPTDSDFAQVVSSELEILLLVFSFPRISIVSHVSVPSPKFQFD